MGIDYFQFQVPRIWYRIYWGTIVAFNVALILLYVTGRFLPNAEPYVHTLGINMASLVIGALNLIYLSVIYWLIARSSLALAALTGSMLFAVDALNGLAQTGAHSGAYVYVGAWVICVFMTGAYGIPLLLGVVLMTFMYASLQSNFEPSKLNEPSIILLIVSLITVVAAHYFWKTRFINVEDQKVNQLSGMLKSNQQQSEILIQSIADGIIVTNIDGKITLMNPAAAAMTEWPVDEATGVDVQLVAKLHKEDGSDIPDEDNPFKRVFNQQEQVNQPLELTGRDDRKIIISLVASPVSIPGSTEPAGAVAVMRDISAEHAAEQQRADFISTASHEMRTPVAAIEGYLSLALNDKVSTIDERARGYLDKAHASTQHLGKLFQDLLTSSKAEDGRLNNHPVVVEMGAYMQQLSDDLKFAAEKKGLVAEFTIGGIDGGTVDATTKDASKQHLLKPLYYTHVDPDRVREVVTNLFDNACKYTDTGKITIGLTGDSEVVQMYIRDTGAGIPADDIPHLFQKFYRVDNSATRTIGGTGLGLFICRKIVEMYHGRIWVESQVGKGSTFFIDLPRLETQKATELQAQEAAKSTSAIPNPVTPTKT